MEKVLREFPISHFKSSQFPMSHQKSYNAICATTPIFFTPTCHYC